MGGQTRSRMSRIGTRNHHPTTTLHVASPLWRNLWNPMTPFFSVFFFLYKSKHEPCVLCMCFPLPLLIISKLHSEMAPTSLRYSPAAVISLLFLLLSPPATAQHDYHDALRKCILFFEGQRSGKLPPDQRLKWRRDSALHDGATVGVRIRAL